MSDCRRAGASVSDGISASRVANIINAARHNPSCIVARHPGRNTARGAKNFDRHATLPMNRGPLTLALNYRHADVPNDDTRERGLSLGSSSSSLSLSLARARAISGKGCDRLEIRNPSSGLS